MAAPQAVDDALVRRTIEELERLVRERGPSRGVGHALKCLVCDRHGHCSVICAEDVKALLSVGADRVGASPGIAGVGGDLASYIDHTLLKPDATMDEFRRLAAEAVKYGFKSVCVNSFWVPLCARLLAGHPVLVCSVVGFPLGACLTEAKAEEARRAAMDGAGEVDMVMNVGALKSGMTDAVLQDIRAVVEAVGPATPVKVILETGFLTDDEKIVACKAAKEAGAAFVKTSTGFGPGGATAADIALMRRVVGPEMGVKASGGIRDREKALQMIEMGATRIGASAGVKIVSGAKGAGAY